MTRGGAGGGHGGGAGSSVRGGLDGRRIGAHLAFAKGGMLKAAERTRAIGATTVQVFADNPTAWRRRNGLPDELPAFRERLLELDVVPTAIHAAYIVNLAGPEDGTDFWARSIDVLAAELGMGVAYGAAIVNVHAGSHRGQGREAGLRQLGRGIARAIDAADLPAGGGPRLVVENSAGGGDTLGDTVEDLAAILGSAVRAGAEADRLAFCLDTAHLWGAGVDLRDAAALDGLLQRFDDLVGPERLALIHLNDSRSTLGSRSDRHQHVGAGAIGAAGLGAVVRHPRLADVPMILETPGMDEGYDAINMERVRLLLAGQPLPELPPEAFELRRSR
ncbi:MAG TPA: deoxyribonuclease IV [Candidatus Limnocylindrales bacterium]|nr:deoxyribonuclease IV [Candidatus Limnocylindrales bacterium]